MIRKLAGIAVSLSLVVLCGCVVSTARYNKDIKAQQKMTQDAASKADAIQKKADAELAAKNAEIQTLTKQLVEAKDVAEKRVKEAAAAVEAAKAAAANAQASQKQLAERVAKAEAQVQILTEQITAVQAASKARIDELAKQLEDAKKGPAK